MGGGKKKKKVREVEREERCYTYRSHELPLAAFAPVDAEMPHQAVPSLADTSCPSTYK